jgi:molybdenum cofactor biosynthesis protein MoaC/non-canonical purine NTP pyrophosphatase (RdgB/HAM1 family)
VTQRLLLATNNSGKLAELRALLQSAALDVDVVTPHEIGLTLSPEENGATYAENAAIKARAFAAVAGLPALADDSGIEIAALGGRPGLHSARYGPPGGSDADRVQALLGEMRDVPDAQRAARFVAAIVIALPDGRTWIAEGELQGVLARAPRGEGGFGYDPVFYLPELGRTVAELNEAAKNKSSHRSRALRAALPGIEQALAAFAGEAPSTGRLTHLDASGRPRMVDVSDKNDTTREATARGRVLMRAETLALILAGAIAKGNVLTTAEIAGVMAAKRTHELIPLCHPLLLTGITVTLTPNEANSAVEIEATVRTSGKTGVEMEALTAASVAGLTIYDMCKAVDRAMRLTDVRLVRKSGGKSGPIVLE